MITCSKCGETMGDDVKFCPSCGTGTSTATQTPDPEPAQAQVPAAPVITNNNNYNTNTGSDNSNVSFGTAIKNFVVKIVDFRSKTCKREYWFGFLFYVIILAGAWVADYIPFVQYAAVGLQIAACLAFISMTVRRLNDLDRPWYRIFMYLIPVYGQILFFQELTK